MDNIRSLSADDTRRLRDRAQGFRAAETAGGVAQVVRSVVAIQAQEAPAAALSIRARSAGLTAAGVERARVDDRSIVRTWCLRGTLHLVAAEDAGWLLSLLGPIFVAADRRRSQQLGLTEAVYAAGVRRVQGALSTRGPLTKAEIAAALRAGRLPAEGQAPIHLIARMAYEGRLCLGPDRGLKSTYVLLADWLPVEKGLPRERALAEIARRYLAAYAPAAPEDLAAWSGLGLRDARAAWNAIAPEIFEVDAAGRPAWLLKTQAHWLGEQGSEMPLVRLLPRFDTYLLGYALRDLILAPEYAKRINAGGGIIHPAVLVDGRVVGRWSAQRTRDRIEIAIDPFEPLDPDIAPNLAAQVSDIARFLGLTIRIVNQQSVDQDVQSLID